MQIFTFWLSLLQMKQSLFFHLLNLISPPTRLWLDSIFNLFVQSSLAHWGNKKREMSEKKDEPSLEHICVRQCSMCCGNLWEHLYPQHDGAFITFFLILWQQRNFNATLVTVHHRCVSVARRGAFNIAAIHVWRHLGVRIKAHPPQSPQCLKMLVKVILNL